MALWKLAGSTALVLVIGGSGAQAEITPEQVWENWQALMASSGQTVTTTSATRDGDTLVVEGLTFTANDGEGTAMTGTIDEVNFADLGDGTVEITMSDSYPITLSLPAGSAEGDTPTTLTIAVSQPGLSMIASGDDAESSYDFEAPTLNLKIEAVEGVAASAVDLVADVTMTGLEGAYTLTKNGDANDLDSSFAAASTSVVVSAKDPETNGDVRLTASVADMAGTSTGTLLPTVDMADMVAALNAGFAMDSAFTFGKTAYDFGLTEDGKPTQITGSVDSGEFQVGMDKTRITYGTGVKNVVLSMSGADIPFPKLDVTYGEGAFKVMMPVAKSDTPQDFTFLTRIVDMDLPDEIWGMFDPTGAFPRDPATVIIDTKGTGNWAFDIMDPVQQEAQGDKTPGQINSLEVTQLEARAGGAEVKGTGSFTFDNTDLVTWDGVPTPTGKMDLTIKGANGVLDKLVAMGMVPEDQAMGARMMIAMFAKPGAGPDELTSSLEFKDKGFFANGQKLR
ncbi:MAG: DUF2125 domain-containing protein [Pseudomonadota bacterium]